MHIIICHGTNQNSVGFQILPVAIRIGISPEEIKIAITAGWIERMCFWWSYAPFIDTHAGRELVKARVRSLLFPSLSSAS